MRELVEMLYAAEDVKRMAPYKWQTCDVIELKMRIADQAKTVRERVLRHAIQSLFDSQVGVGAAFVRNVIRRISITL